MIIGIAILALLVVIVIMQGIILSNNMLKDNNDTEAGLSKTEQELLDIVSDSLNALTDYSFFTEVQTSDDTVVSYVYNNYGEALSQEVYDKAIDDQGETVSGMHTIVYLKNGTSVEYDEHISYTDTIDVVKLLRLAEQTTQDGLGIITVNKNPQMDNPDGRYEEINIDIRSYLNISHMYSKVSDIYAYNEVEALRNIVARMKESDDSIDTDHVNLRFIYLVDTELREITSASCWLYFGTEDSDKVTYDSDTTLYAQWIMTDRHIIDDWSLEEGWYTTDWSTVDKWEDLTVAEDLLIGEYEKITDILYKHYGFTDDTLTTDDIIEDEDTDTGVDTDTDTGSEVTDTDVDSEATE